MSDARAPKRIRWFVGVAAVTVAAMIGAGCTPTPSSPAPANEHFCDLWAEVEGDPTPTGEPVVVNDEVVARAESANTLGQDCTDPSSQVVLDEAMLAEGEVQLVEAVEVPSDGQQAQLMGQARVAETQASASGEAPGESHAVVTGDRIAAETPVLDNVRLRSISAWIDWNGITVQGAADVTLSGVTSTIQFTGTLRDLDNWSIHLSSTAFRVPGITTTPATFSGSLTMSGGEPSLTLSAGIAAAQIGDVAVEDATLELDASPSTGVSATVAGSVQVGDNSAEGTVEVAFDSTGAMVSAHAQVSVALSGWDGGDFVSLEGQATFDGNGQDTLISFSGHGQIGAQTVIDANGSLTIINGVVTFEGDLDAMVEGARVRFNGHITWDGDQASTPIMDLEAAGDYSAVLPDGQVLDFSGTVTHETGYGGETYTVVTGDFELGALSATGAAIVETDGNGGATMQVDAELNSPNLNGVQIAGYVLIEDGYAMQVELDAAAESLTFGPLSLTDVGLSVRGGWDEPLAISIAGNFSVDGDMATGHLDAAAQFGPDGALLSLESNADVAVALDLDGIQIEASADISLSGAAVTVDATGSVDIAGVPLFVSGTLTADLNTQDWEFRGTGGFDWAIFHLDNITVILEPGSVRSLDFQFWLHGLIFDYGFVGSLHFHNDGTPEYAEFHGGLGAINFLIASKLAEVIGIPIYTSYL